MSGLCHRNGKRTLLHMCFEDVKRLILKIQNENKT